MHGNAVKMFSSQPAPSTSPVGKNESGAQELADAFAGDFAERLLQKSVCHKICVSTILEAMWKLGFVSRYPY